MRPWNSATDTLFFDACCPPNPTRGRGAARDSRTASSTIYCEKPYRLPPSPTALSNVARGRKRRNIGRDWRVTRRYGQARTCPGFATLLGLRRAGFFGREAGGPRSRCKSLRFSTVSTSRANVPQLELPRSSVEVRGLRCSICSRKGSAAYMHRLRSAGDIRAVQRLPRATARGQRRMRRVGRSS